MALFMVFAAALLAVIFCRVAEPGRGWSRERRLPPSRATRRVTCSPATSPPRTATSFGCRARSLRSREPVTEAEGAPGMGRTAGPSGRGEGRGLEVRVKNPAWAPGPCGWCSSLSSSTSAGRRRRCRAARGLPPATSSRFRAGGRGAADGRGVEAGLHGETFPLKGSVAQANTAYQVLRDGPLVAFPPRDLVHA